MVDEREVSIKISAKDVASEVIKRIADVSNGLYVSLGRVNDLSLRFAGAGVTQRAEEYAAAVQRIGGASKLTASEQEEVNRAVEAAIEKYTALGQVAPEALRRLADQTKQENKGLKEALLGAKDGASLIDDQFKKFVAGFTVASLLEKTADAAIEYTAEIYKNADALVNQSAKTGVNIEWLQRWQAVAKKSNIDSQALADGAYKFGIAFQGGSDDVKKALHDIGLSYDDLKSKSPEERMDGVIRALAGVTDAGRRNYDGNVLLAKSYAELAPALGDYASTVDGVEVHSESLIRALHRQKEAIDELETRLTGGFMESVGGIALVLNAIADGGENAHRAMVAMSATMTARGPDWAAAGKMLATYQDAVSNLTNEEKAHIKILVEAGRSNDVIVQAVASGSDALAAASLRYAESLRKTEEPRHSYTQDLKEARDVVAKLTAEQKAEIKSGVEANQNAKEIADNLNRSLHQQAGEAGLTELAVSQYIEALRKSKKVQDDAGAAVEKHREKIKDFADELTGAKLAQEVSDIAASVDLAAKKGGLMASEYASLGSRLSKLRDDGAQLPPQLGLIAVASDITNTKYGTTAELLKVLSGSTKSYVKELADAPGAAIAFADAQTSAVESLTERVVALSRSKRDQQIADIEAARKKELDAIADLKTKEPKAFDDRKLLIDQFYDHQLGVVRGTYDTLEQRLAANGVFTRSQLADNLKAERTTLDQMIKWNAEHVENERYTADQIEAQKKRVHDAQRAMANGWGQLEYALEDQLKAIPQTLANAFENGGDIMGAVKSIISQVGAAIGGELGYAIAGPMGEEIGAAVGSMLGLITSIFKGHASAKDVAKQWGLTFSDTLQKTINDQAKQLFHGDLVTATIYNLKSIIDEAGGLTTANYAMYVGRLRDVFVAVSRGTMTAAQGAKVLDDNFQTFIDQATDGVGLLDAKMVELIKLDAALGTDSKAIAEYRKQQFESAESGIGAALGVTSDAYAALADLQKQQADIQAQLATASSDQQADLQAQLAATTQQIETQKAIIAATGITSQQTAAAVASAIIGTIDAERAAGKSFIQSVLAAAPSIKGLQQQMDAAGLSGSAAFQFIKDELDLATDAVAGPALTAIQGYTQGIVGLANAGLLTQDEFSGMEAQIGATRERLEGMGKSHGAVMAAMQGDLQVAWEMEQKYGFTLDENTQRMVDEAVAADLVGETHKSTTEQMLDGINRMADATERLADLLVGPVQRALRQTGNAGVDAFTRITDAIGDIPREIDVDVHGNVRMGGGGASGGSVPAFATEAYVRAPTLAMIGDVPGGELVLKPSTVNKWLHQSIAASAIAASMAAATVAPVVNVTINGGDGASVRAMLRNGGLDEITKAVAKGLPAALFKLGVR